jgi:hypothetical protein
MGKGALEWSPLAFSRHDDSYIDTVEYLPGTTGSQIAKHPGIIDPRRIDKKHGPERQKFHGLFHRIGRGTGYRRNDGDILPCNCIEDTRLTDIPPSEYPDMQPKIFWGFLHFIS